MVTNAYSSQAISPEEPEEPQLDVASVCMQLFDADWYAENNADLGEVKDPVRHYIDKGAEQRRDPHPLFSTGWYLDNYSDVLDSGMNPLFHFIVHGGSEGRIPHPIFDSQWYLHEHLSLKDMKGNPLTHYIKTGRHEGASPNQYFDANWYVSQNPDSAKVDKLPIQHFIEFGRQRLLDPGPNFNTKVYLALSKDAASSTLDPLSHYLAYGRRKGKPQLQLRTTEKVAVVFLARSENGSTAGIDRFAQSYRKYPSGTPHDLIVIRKGGMRKEGSKLALDLMLSGLNPQYIDIDDAGYDIQAYVRTASVLENDYLCFLNTHSEIMAPDWLLNLLNAMNVTGVGVAGATASYESIYDSIGMGCKAVWLTEIQRGPFDEDLASELRDHLEAHAPTWMKARDTPVKLSDRRLFPKDQTACLDDTLAYIKYWDNQTRLGGTLYAMDRFKRFPNPHLRSNAFMIKRRTLVDFDFDMEDSKLACLEFESGPTGLPARIQNLGLKSVLVGANGNIYEVEDWPDSNTFRLGDQSNIMVSDNRVRDYDTLSGAERRRLGHISWGEYVGRVPAVYAKLGFHFRKGSLRLPDLPKKEQRVWTPSISVVIPTHNRLSLVKDALATIVGQKYLDWECIVFDNASEEPLAAHIASLDEGRIKYSRSDTFLPVTDSWNAAIDKASGDYVILIGDDDGVVPDCFSRLAGIINKFGSPDVVYSSLYQFFHPGVAPWEPSGTVAELQYALFFNGEVEEFQLKRETARAVVASSLQLRRCFTFNMQGFYFRRTFLDSLRRQGKVFHSPFPDYYLANVALYLSESTIVAPRPLSVAGVSRKSYGFTLFNNQQSKGDALLNTEFEQDPLYDQVRVDLLPGPTYNSNYLITMKHVAKAIGMDVNASVRTDRYRKIHIHHALGGVGMRLEGSSNDMSLASFNLTGDEEKWVADVQRLCKLARVGDDKAAERLIAIADEVKMYVPGELAVRARTLSTGDFASLTQLFGALQDGSLLAGFEGAPARSP